MNTNYAAISAALQKMSDQQLTQEMSNPSGQVPQFLIMTEIQRRKGLRATQTQPVNTNTVASQMKAPAAAPAPAQMGVAGQPEMASADPQAYAAGGIVGFDDGTGDNTVAQAAALQDPSFLDMLLGATKGSKGNAFTNPTQALQGPVEGPGLTPYEGSSASTKAGSAPGSGLGLGTMLSNVYKSMMPAQPPGQTVNGFNQQPGDPDLATLEQPFQTQAMQPQQGMGKPAGWQNPEGQSNIDKYLNAIANVESGNRPNVIVGGKTFSDFSQHPNVVGVTTEDGPSTAAGLYQITGTTWREEAKKLGLKDFSPASQRAVALSLIEKNGAMNDVMNGDFNAANRKLGKVWQGLPTGASPNQGHSTQAKFEAGLGGANNSNLTSRTPPAIQTGLDPRLMAMMGNAQFQPVPVSDEPDAPDRPEASDIDALAKKVNDANPDMLGSVLDRTDARLAALKGRKDDNISQAMMMAGLGMMAGKSRYAMQNIGEGGIAGLKQYTAQEENRIKDEMAIQQHRDSVVAAQQAAKAGNFKTAAELAKNADLTNASNYGHDTQLYGMQQGMRRNEMQFNNMGQHQANQMNLGIMGQALGENRMENQFNQQLYHTDALYNRNDEMASLRQQANQLHAGHEVRAAADSAYASLQKDYIANKPMMGAMNPQAQAQYAGEMDAWIKQRMMEQNPDLVKARWGANAFTTPIGSAPAYDFKVVNGKLVK
jgi:muramidase (phage lysozyme)